MEIYAVILAGGMGSRLWPLSRELYPKQLLKLIGDDSLIQGTVKRLNPLVPDKNIRVVCGQEHYFEILRHLEAIGFNNGEKNSHIITEPIGRNTAPAIALALRELADIENDCLVLVLPADHIIKDIEAFQDSIKKASAMAIRDYIVTFGIKPVFPETGYGYIQSDTPVEGTVGYKVKRFVEKPDFKTAQAYINSGDYFWNSGIFLFKSSFMLKEMETYMPDLLSELGECHEKGSPIKKELYAKLPSISIDYGIMEKTGRASVLPATFAWSDIGSWQALYDLLPKDNDENVVTGYVKTIDTKNSLIRADKRLVTTIGLSDMVVVETPDALLVSTMDRSQEVKEIVSELKIHGSEEYRTHVTVYRPWGTYTVLEQGPGFQIKRIEVYPGAKLSLQMHFHRSEHWVVVSGTARIINDDKELFLEENQSTYIPKAKNHRLENPGKILLQIIEVQIGSYLGEDDIVRFDDEFGRVE